MQQLSADDDLRCVVLRGAGDKAFCAGADIGAFPAERGTDEREAEYAHVLDESMQSIRLCQHPVVAMIMGYCLGGGAGIATMCDFRVGGEGIRMGITARNLASGIRMPRSTRSSPWPAPASPSEMLIEGRIFNGREAYEKGLLSRVVPDALVESEASHWPAGSPRAPPCRPATTKRRSAACAAPLPVTREEEAATSDFTRTEDFQNACRSFMAKQKPVFRGR